MLVLQIILIFSVSRQTVADTPIGAFKRLDFPDPPTINNYVRYDVADFGEISEFSVALWIREHEHQVSNMRYIFSYSSDGGRYDVNIERSTWYHIVLCWDNKSGFTLFKDGSLVDSGDLKLSAAIKSGGVLILGQDQDTLGGGFQEHQSFSGSLNELNWFKKKLTTEQVKDIFDNGKRIRVPSSLEENLILDWSDVIKLPLTGAVTLQNEILRDGCRMIEHYNGRCIEPKVSPAQVGTKLTMQSTCEGEYFLFCYGNDERIYHAQTNLCLMKEGLYLQLGPNCDEDSSRWEFTSGKSIRQISSGLCWQPEGGREDSGDGTRIHVAEGCDQNRLQFTWVTNICSELPKDWIYIRANLPVKYGTLLTLSCEDDYIQTGDKVVTCNPNFSILDTPKCFKNPNSIPFNFKLRDANIRRNAPESRNRSKKGAEGSY
ncbi:hypothetical protein ACHWQZ_G007737 [Mnemiopsis leidyi]